MGIFEAGMLVCFGASWPIAIWKTVKAKNPAGKSIFFLILIIIGYLLGIANKFYNNNLDWVVWLYVLNTVLVATDMVLCLYYQSKLNQKI